MRIFTLDRVSAKTSVINRGCVGTLVLRRLLQSTKRVFRKNCEVFKLELCRKSVLDGIMNTAHEDSPAKPCIAYVIPGLDRGGCEIHLLAMLPQLQKWFSVQIFIFHDHY